MSHHFIDFNNVKYSYPDGRKAINGITARITHGEAVGLVGANGAGKSTLLSMVVGILMPLEGEIRIGETPVTKRTLSHIRERVGLLFQDADDQLFMNTVYDDVAFGPRNYRLDENEVEARVKRSLDAVGSWHLKDRAPYKLSGGEKRAAAIAALLAMEPDILLMDEPTTALDPRARRRLINLLKTFTHTKVIATHDLDLVLDICDRTIIIDDGRIAADGPSLKILSDGVLLEKCGLEMPLSIQSCPVCGKKGLQ